MAPCALFATFSVAMAAVPISVSITSAARPQPVPKAHMRR